jgi:GSCFA family
MNHPYRSLPPYCFWRQSMAQTPPDDVDPVVRGRFTITPTDRVATAGSCFAQHIARYLKKSGFRYFITELAHPMVPPDVARRFGYGLFTARFGNIYTSRQLLQLFQRAYGLFQPVDDMWRRADGRLIDPFRPQVQPDGFASELEYRLDRERHFAAVRRFVERMDVFVFTLGLTEGWVSREDGAAYPLCPGVAGGTFDPARHEFVNLRASEIITDMLAAIDFIRARNKNVKVLLTVSPVPLVATAEDRSVLVSTTYSKSALRVACEEIAAARADVAYFPSYEIITGNYNRGAYFGDDLREVTEAGVAHVMRLFLAHYTLTDALPAAPAAPKPAREGHLLRMERAAAVVCDEEALDAL